MRNLSRIAFVIALAACGDAKNQIDACELDPNTIACRCEIDGTLPECNETPIGCTTNEDCQTLSDGNCLVGACTLDVCDAVNVCEGEGVVSGEFVAFPQDNGNTFLGVQVDLSESFDAFVDFDEAEAASVPLDGCIDVEFPNIDGEPDRRSVGDIAVSKGGAPVTNLMFDAGTGRYEEIVTNVLPGDTLDVAFPGEGAIGQHNFIGFAAMPDAFPSFTGLVNNQLDLTAGIVMHAPLTGSYIKISTSFIEGQTGVSLECGTDGSGMIVIPPATLARLPASGSLNLSVINREYRPLTSDDGAIRLFRSFVRMTKSVQYTKS